MTQAAAPVPNRRTMALHALLLLALLVPATRLAVLVHEALGHALIAAILGARVSSLSISLFGGGSTSYAFGPGTGAAARALAAWGGIAVNLLSGWLILALGRRLDRRPAVSLAAVLFAASSLLGAVAYAALGLYYGVGDPAAGGGAMWSVWLAAAPVAAWVALRRFGELQEALLPSRGVARRIGIATVTLGSAVAAYAGLFALEGAPLVAVDAAAIAHRRAVALTRQERLQAALAEARAARPELDEASLRRLAEDSLDALRPEEVPAPPPLAPLLAGLFALGAVGGLAGPIPVPPASSAWNPARPAAKAAILAAAILALLLLARLESNGPPASPRRSRLAAPSLISQPPRACRFRERSRNGNTPRASGR